jgi:hypothetical protein
MFITKTIYHRSAKLTRVISIDIVFKLIPSHFFTRLPAENAESEKAVRDEKTHTFSGFVLPPASGYKKPKRMRK